MLLQTSHDDFKGFGYVLLGGIRYCSLNLLLRDTTVDDRLIFLKFLLASRSRMQMPSGNVAAETRPGGKYSF